LEELDVVGRLDQSGLQYLSFVLEMSLQQLDLIQLELHPWRQQQVQF
jgi:hypothetical protein